MIKALKNNIVNFPNNKTDDRYDIADEISGLRQDINEPKDYIQISLPPMVPLSTQGPFGVATRLYPACAAEADLMERFKALYEKWKAESSHQSSMTRIAMNPAYQQIIGMGPRVLPFIFESMLRKPDHWFWALEAITGLNAVREEHIGDVERMTSDWLEWASDNGY